MSPFNLSSLLFWIGLHSFTQQAMEFQSEAFGWLDDATLFPARKQQEVFHPYDLLLTDLTFPGDGKAKDIETPTVADIPNVVDILDGCDWMDEKIDLSILDSTFQDCPVTDDVLKHDHFDVASELDSLVDNYFQPLLPFESNLSVSPTPSNNQSVSAVEVALVPEAVASSPEYISSDAGLQLPSSPVDSSWSDTSSIVSTSPRSDGNVSDVSESSSNIEQEPVNFDTYYIQISAPEAVVKNTRKIIKSRVVRANVEPYSLAPYQQKKETKRERKKVQNKEAAARYRLKKREQDKVLGDEVSTLENEQQVLQNKHDELKTEIKYLKSLMREMFKARGLLK